MCTLIIGIFIFVVAIFGTDLVRKVASVLSICIIAGLLIVYIPNIFAGSHDIAAAVQTMKSEQLPFGKALYSAFIYGTFQLANIAVFVQHAKSFQKPGNAAKSMGIGFVINYGTEWRGKSIHDTAALRVDHSGRGFHSCKYGGSHGKKDLQRPGKNAEG